MRILYYTHINVSVYIWMLHTKEEAFLFIHPHIFFKHYVKNFIPQWDWPSYLEKIKLFFSLSFSQNDEIKTKFEQIWVILL